MEIPLEKVRVSKSQILGRKLTDYELKLYEYSAYSLSEEIDLFYCAKIN